MVSTRFILVITIWSYQCLPNFLRLHCDSPIHKLSDIMIGNKNMTFQGLKMSLVGKYPLLNN